jgi:chaperonin GroEL
VLADGVNPMLLRRGIEEAVDLVVAELLRSAQTIGDIERLGHVATIAAEEDERIGLAVAERIGLAVAEALHRVGEEGVVSVEETELRGSRSSSSRACTSRTAISRLA